VADAPDLRSDLAWFILERHLGPMVAIAGELGDDLVNVTPDLPGANSGYVIVWHSAAVVQWWTRHVILGQEHPRDRESEFSAAGDVASLTARVDEVRRGLLEDLPKMQLAAAPASDPGPGWGDAPIRRSVGGVLLHLVEELAQHHGHLQLTRDLLKR
jgi:hypothetical protein